MTIFSSIKNKFQLKISKKKFSPQIEAGHVLRMFLFFWRFQPGCSYKRCSYKKKVYVVVVGSGGDGYCRGTAPAWPNSAKKKKKWALSGFLHTNPKSSLESKYIIFFYNFIARKKWHHFFFKMTTICK